MSAPCERQDAAVIASVWCETQRGSSPRRWSTDQSLCPEAPRGFPDHAAVCTPGGFAFTPLGSSVWVMKSGSHVVPDRCRCRSPLSQEGKVVDGARSLVLERIVGGRRLAQRNWEDDAGNKHSA